MNFIKLYCHRNEQDILINLDRIKGIMSAVRGGDYVIYFMVSDGKIVIYFETKESRTEAEKLIASKVLSSKSSGCDTGVKHA